MNPYMNEVSGTSAVSTAMEIGDGEILDLCFSDLPKLWTQLTCNNIGIITRQITNMMTGPYSTSIKRSNNSIVTPINSVWQYLVFLCIPHSCVTCNECGQTNEHPDRHRKYESISVILGVI